MALDLPSSLKIAGRRDLRCDIESGLGVESETAAKEKFFSQGHFYDN
ncbi:MAG: hypothetical protein AB4352_21640 [Hormoscilla sp.]